MMLQVTVRTLDERSRNYSVQDDITVRAFKERISQSVNVPAASQRLLFRGRALDDDALLNATGEINGNVIHLVQGAPPRLGGSERQPTAPSGSPRTADPTARLRVFAIISQRVHQLADTAGLDLNQLAGAESVNLVRLASMADQIRIVEDRISRLERCIYGPDFAIASRQSTNTASEPATSRATQTNSSQDTSNARHSRIHGICELVRKSSELEARFVPFLNNYAGVLETYSDFESVENAEFQRMDEFITQFMEAQRSIGVMHQMLGRIELPVPETPSRSILVDGPDRARTRSTIPQSDQTNRGFRSLQTGPGFQVRLSRHRQDARPLENVSVVPRRSGSRGHSYSTSSNQPTSLLAGRQTQGDILRNPTNRRSATGIFTSTQPASTSSLQSLRRSQRTTRRPRRLGYDSRC